jgi:hypothetical protein
MYGNTFPLLGEIVVCGGSDIYHKTVVAKELLELRPTVTYEVVNWSPAGLECGFPGCDGMDDVATLSGRPSVGHSQGSKRGEVPMVQEIRM